MSELWPRIRYEIRSESRGLRLRASSRAGDAGRRDTMYDRDGTGLPVRDRSRPARAAGLRAASGRDHRRSTRARRAARRGAHRRGARRLEDPVREALIRPSETASSRSSRIAVHVRPRASEQDVREILELRLLLECQIARGARRPAPPEVLDALDASIGEYACEAGRSGRPPGPPRHAPFSDIMTRSLRGNSRMGKLLDDLRSVCF